MPFSETEALPEPAKDEEQDFSYGHAELDALNPPNEVVSQVTDTLVWNSTEIPKVEINI